MAQKILSQPIAAPGVLEIGELVRRLLRDGERHIYRQVGVAVDRAVIEAVLHHTRGSQLKASRLLGMSRGTLRGKLRALGLAVEKLVLQQADLDACPMDRVANFRRIAPTS
jgi:two-component system nitrogen regulation response regulator GlnG